VHQSQSAKCELSHPASLAYIESMTKKGRPVFRHETILRQLIADIRSGVYAVETQLPPELDLCETFSASRHTVRQALANLTSHGLIARRASSGSMIIAAHEPRILVQSPELMATQLNGPTDLLRTIV
jgi:GntR family transcriptional regulator